MGSKTAKVFYWIVTLLFALAMFYSGISELMQNQQAQDVLKQLGYPVYLNIILGIAKVLGAIALLQPWFRTIKEWAYAGFTFDILGASLSMFFTGTGILMSLTPLVFLLVMFISYGLWKKVSA